MKIIHVLRKPCSESTVVANVLKHGCGGLNIDISRIAYPTGKPESGWAKTGANGTKGFQGTSTFRIRESSAEEIQARVAKGRWPANLILQHKDDCALLGSQRVKAVSAEQLAFRSGMGYGSKAAGTYDGVRIKREGDGKETVPLWECVEDCPVKDLDGQSGICVSGTNAPHHNRHVPRLGHGGCYGNDMGTSPPKTWPGDKGGASRFFKQVKKA